MRRRNPATASSPNPQFEMTSFMDIIFIFLFVVMVGYAMKCGEEKDRANDKMSEAERMLAEAEDKAAQAQESLADLAVYKQQLQDLSGSVIGSRVQIVTITCTYDAGDAKDREEWERHLRVLSPEQEMLVERDFTESTAGSTYEILKETLEQYIKDVQEKDREEAGERYNTDKQARTVIVISINREDGGILTRDYEGIASVIRDLEIEYEDVY